MTLPRNIYYQFENDPNGLEVLAEHQIREMLYAPSLQVSTLPSPITGTTTGVASGSVLIDSTATFVTDGVVAGDIVGNITDSSFAVVKAVNSETQLTLTKLIEGTDNTWSTSDSYAIKVVPHQQLTLDTTDGTNGVGAYKRNAANTAWERANTLDTVSQAEAEAATATIVRAWTAQRIKQMIDANVSGSTAIATQAQAEAGEDNTVVNSPLRTNQQIQAHKNELLYEKKQVQRSDDFSVNDNEWEVSNSDTDSTFTVSGGKLTITEGPGNFRLASWSERNSYGKNIVISVDINANIKSAMLNFRRTVSSDYLLIFYANSTAHFRFSKVVSSITTTVVENTLSPALSNAATFNWEIKVFNNHVSAILRDATGEILSMIASNDSILETFIDPITGLASQSSSDIPQFDNYKSKIIENFVNVVCLGDSNTQRLAASLDFGRNYPALMLDKFKNESVTIINEGLAGDKIAEVDARLSTALFPRRTKEARNIATLLIGTNDFGRSTVDTVVNATAALTTLIQNIMKDGWELYLMTYFPANGDELEDKGDASSQLSNLDLTEMDSQNSDAGILYWELTDTAGTRKFSLFSDVAKTALVVEGTLVGDGTITLTEQNNSGMSGSIDIAFTVDDTDGNNKIHSKNQKLREYNTFIRKNTKVFGYHVVDLWSSFVLSTDDDQTQGGLILGDNLHLDTAGRELVRDTLIAAIFPLGIESENNKAKQRIHEISDANYTLTLEDKAVFMKTLTAPRTITFPSALIGIPNFEGWLIADIAGAAATHTITLASEGSETFNGSATATITTDNGNKRIYSDGSNLFF